MDRRLTTIVAADLVGYSRLIAADEEGTILRLREIRKRIIDPALGEQDGRLIKTMGDGLLVEFPSTNAALRATMDIQRATAQHEKDRNEDQRMRFRIGINLGDVVIDGTDILGDGVNIAARLESLAPPGGICISRAVYEQVKGKINGNFIALGPQQVKNIPDPVEVWQVDIDGVAPAPSRPVELAKRPSLVVLPFDNMSSDPEQEFLADGIVEDVTTELSRFRSLFVIARNSAFAYKGARRDVREIARELDVTYVVEGSVRRAGNRLRVTAQLIEAETGVHIWAERWDRTMDDLFDVQDELTAAIVSGVEPELGAHERSMARRKSTDNLTAWELYQRGNIEYLNSTEEGYAKSFSFLTQAIAADPNFALPHALLGRWYYYHIFRGQAQDVEAEVRAGLDHAHAAIKIDDREELGYVALVSVLAVTGHEHEARTALEKGEALNPNNVTLSMARGIYHMFQTNPDCDKWEAAALKAIQLSPRDPNLWAYQAFVGSARLTRLLDLSDPGVREAFEASASNQNAEAFPHVLSAPCNVNIGRLQRARVFLENALELDPNLTLANLQTYSSAPLWPKLLAAAKAELETLVELGLPRE